MDSGSASEADPRSGVVGSLSEVVVRILPWEFVAKVIPSAAERGLSTVLACNSWYTGAYLLETVPSVLYILTKYGHDPEEALVRAVNDTRDNDTVAAIVGAMAGALHGRARLPSRWVEKLRGWVGLHQDRRVFELLDQAREVFWESSEKR